MVFIERDQIGLHLGWCHSAVRLDHIDGGQSEVGKDVDGHAGQRKDGTERYRDDDHKDSHRTTQGRKKNPHDETLSEFSDSKNRLSKQWAMRRLRQQEIESDALNYERHRKPLDC